MCDPLENLERIVGVLVLDPEGGWRASYKVYMGSSTFIRGVLIFTHSHTISVVIKEFVRYYYNVTHIIQIRCRDKCPNETS